MNSHLHARGASSGHWTQTPLLRPAAATPKGHADVDGQSREWRRSLDSVPRISGTHGIGVLPQARVYQSTR